MDEHGTKIPTVRDLFRYVQELSLRLEKTEKELAKLKGQVNTRQKKAILEWLNQPKQRPEKTFEEWYKEMDVTESHIMCVAERDLTYGFQKVIDEQLGDKIGLPIRTFTQKPNTFYVYSREADNEPHWRIMSNEQMDTMLLGLSQSFVREFLKWQKKQDNRENQDERETDREIMFMMKINGTRTSSEKRLQEIKKWLFPKIEENLRVIMECEFE
jgi:hypothetical protein